MKYLQKIDFAAQDALDEVYGEIVTPCVRYLADTESVIARNNVISDKENAYELLCLLANSNSSMDIEEYVNAVISGSVVSDYAKTLIGNDTVDEFVEKESTLPDGYRSAFDKEVLSSKLSEALSFFESYGEIEYNLSNQIFYSEDNDFDVYASVSSDTTYAEDVRVNLSECFSELLNFKGSGGLNNIDLMVLKVLYKYFPENIYSTAFNSAKTLITANSGATAEVIDYVLGLEEADEDAISTYDLNGNGAIDYEDACAFLCYDVFADAVSTSSDGPRRVAPATKASSNITVSATVPVPSFQRTPTSSQVSYSAATVSFSALYQIKLERYIEVKKKENSNITINGKYYHYSSTVKDAGIKDFTVNLCWRELNSNQPLEYWLKILAKNQVDVSYWQDMVYGDFGSEKFTRLIVNISNVTNIVKPDWL